MKHPNQATLALHAGGDLGAVAGWRARRHLARCAECREEVARFAECRQWLPSIEDSAGVHWNRLAAEMKLPGRAWLEFDVEPTRAGVILRQTATFDPVWLCGIGYWYALFPLHELVFRGMIRKLARAAAGSATESEPAKAP